MLVYELLADNFDIAAAVKMFVDSDVEKFDEQSYEMKDHVSNV